MFFYIVPRVRSLIMLSKILKKFGPVAHLSSTNNGLSHIIKFHNITDARKAAESPYINIDSRRVEVFITFITNDLAGATQPEYTDDGSVDYDIEGYVAEAE